MERGKWDEAETMLSQAVQQCPVDPDARRAYGEALWHRGAAREAVEQFEQAIANGRQDGALAVMAGDVYLATGDTESARRKANQAIQLDPRLPQAWALRARAELRDGRHRAALADYHRALAQAPSDTLILRETAELYQSLGEGRRALTTIEKLVETYPPGEVPPETLALFATALSGQGRHQDAAEQLRAVIDRGGPNAEILYRIGEAEMLAGNHHRAAEAASRAVTLNPAHVAARQLQQRIQASLSGPDRAIRR